MRDVRRLAHVESLQGLTGLQQVQKPKDAVEHANIRIAGNERGAMTAELDAANQIALASKVSRSAADAPKSAEEPGVPNTMAPSRVIRRPTVGVTANRPVIPRSNSCAARFPPGEATTSVLKLR